MKVNIYYGGRGLIEDPALYVIKKITQVLKELRVNVDKYNLFEDKNNITILPNTFKEADGIILVASVEWTGIGGYLQQFLDACWLYGDKTKLSSLYTMPVVISTTYGERDAYFSLHRAMDILGVLPVNGICAYVEDRIDFETNNDYTYLIEKRTEDLYRSISKKAATFPSSIGVVKENVFPTTGIDLTPQESEQLSKYVSDESYVKKQKEDIEELASLFKDMLGENETEEETETDDWTSVIPEAEAKPNAKLIDDDRFIPEIKAAFCPIDNVALSYSVEFTDRNRTLVISLNGNSLSCYYGEHPGSNIVAKTDSATFEKIVKGELTFQTAFMAGSLTAQGNFKVLRSFDTLFQFNKS